MSGFIGAAQPVASHGREDIRLRRDRPNDEIFSEVTSAIAPALYTSDYWPRSGLVGNLGLDVSILERTTPWKFPQPYGGAASRYGFVGVTRDQYGTAIPSCVAKLYRTSDDSLQDTTTSDATTGEFLLNTFYYPDAHYIVAHKAGSPDVDGASVNTLIGT